MVLEDEEEKGLREVALRNAHSILLARGRAEEALRASEERYRSLTQAITSIVWTTDDQGRVVTPQPSWAEYTGQTWEQLRDHGWADALHPGDRERVRALWREERAPNRIYKTEGRLWHAATGAYRRFEARAVPVLRADGSLREWVCTCVDVEERNRLQESEKRLASLVESSYDAIVGKSLDGIIQSWNPAAERLFGYTAEQAIGRHVSFLIPADRADEEGLIIARLRAGERIEHFDTVRMRSDGQPIQVSLTISPIKSADGRIVGASKIARDITERKRAEEALRRNAETFSKLVHQAPFGIYVVDSRFRISEVSAGAQPVFGNVRPLIGRDFSEAVRIIWPEPFAREVIEIFRHTLETGEPYLAPSLTEHRRDLEAVESYEWQIHRVTLPDGQYGVVCYFFDATRLREAERELLEADRRKNEFLAILAHELRNPLAPIRSSLQVIRRIRGDDGEVQPVLQIIERQVDQIVRLVDDLLDVSRISRGKIELRKQRVELASVIADSVEAARPLVDGMGQDLTVTMPPDPTCVDADPVRLAQVVGNLLNNASKFSAHGGRIRLIVEREGGQAVIRVQDEGIGIAPDELPRIFDMFTQADTSRERSQSGLGIGLTLVKDLVRLHDGTVEGLSAGTGKGSEFVVRLPLSVEDRKPATPPQDSAGARVAAPARRILVVDDNRDSAEALAMLLSLSGNETRAAYDGLEALEAAEKFRPDAVLLDIGLPGLNGYDVARAIRKQPGGADIVLVALTGWGQEEDREKSREAGFDAHMVKPLNDAALMELLAGITPRTGRESER